LFEFGLNKYWFVWIIMAKKLSDLDFVKDIDFLCEFASIHYTFIKKEMI